MAGTPAVPSEVEVKAGEIQHLIPIYQSELRLFTRYPEYSRVVADTVQVGRLARAVEQLAPLSSSEGRRLGQLGDELRAAARELRQRSSELRVWADRNNIHEKNAKGLLDRSRRIEDLAQELDRAV